MTERLVPSSPVVVGVTGHRNLGTTESERVRPILRDFFLALVEQNRGFPVVEDYPTPEAMAQALEADLWAVLDKAYPAEEVPDAFEREHIRHEAFAAQRRSLYIGAQRYVSRLRELLDGAQRILIEGASGGGKSAPRPPCLQRARDVRR